MSFHRIRGVLALNIFPASLIVMHQTNPGAQEVTSRFLATCLFDSKYLSPHEWRTVSRVQVCICDVISEWKWGPCCCSVVGCSLRPGTNFLSKMKVCQFPELENTAKRLDCCREERDSWKNANSGDRSPCLISNSTKWYGFKRGKQTVTLCISCV